MQVAEKLDWKGLNSAQESGWLGICTACDKALGIHWIRDWSD
jgi:hypothetical protein